MGSLLVYINMRTFKNTDEIRAERLNNRTNTTVYNLLGVLLGELDRRPNQNSPITEQDIYKNIKKLYDAAIECGNEEEKEYLEEFIKKQLTDQELRDAINTIKYQGYRNIGDIMKLLSLQYPGQYDGKKAAQFARS